MAWLDEYLQGETGPSGPAGPPGPTPGAGNGITYSGGDYSVNPDPDGSIVVTSFGVKVGVLANDTEHGTRGNGSLHSVADGTHAGFMPSAMWSVVNGISSGGSLALGSQSPQQYQVSAQPSVPIATGVAANLLTTPLSIPVGSVVVVRSVVIGRISTPTQGTAALLTSIAELGDVAGSPVVIFGGPVSQETNVPTQPWGSSFGGQLSAMVTGATDNGAGLIRLQFANTNNGMATGNTLAIANVGGVPAATGSWTITNVGDSTHIDLQGSAFAGSYTSGGTAVPQAASGVALVGGTNIQFQATGITPANWIQSQAVKKNDLRVANANVYICTAQGTTAATGAGPSGTGTGISDGTSTWDWAATASAGITVVWTVCKLEVFSG